VFSPSSAITLSQLLRIARHHEAHTNIPNQILNRTQYKHVLHGPSLWDYEGNYFPFIRDAVEAKDWALAQKQLEKTASIISAAGNHLVGNNVGKGQKWKPSRLVRRLSFWR
jgi:hypothetical protein